MKIKEFNISYKTKKINVDINESITKSKLVYNLMKQILGNEISIRECFYIILLNNNLNLCGYSLISIGTINSTQLDIRIIAKIALDALATSVILVHNHPSGNLTPSYGDIEVTKKIKKGLMLLDINVIDHIIVAEDNYYSFADNNII